MRANIKEKTLSSQRNFVENTEIFRKYNQVKVEPLTPAILKHCTALLIQAGVEEEA